jgi:glutathione S-transferase
MIKLYEAPMSTCTQKVRFVLEQKSLSWEGVPVDLHSGENFSSEYMKLNPKGVIPALVDGEDAIIESNNICQYLDEKYPQVPLMPDTPKGRSDVRTLLQLIDEHVHSDVSACTYAIAFRERITKQYDTPEKLEAYIAEIPDTGKRLSRSDYIANGIESPAVSTAVVRIVAVLQRLEGLLQNSPYLVGDQLTLADIAYSPYITRLDHLSMDGLWKEMPAWGEWYEQIQTTTGYQKGMKAYFVDGAIESMRSHGNAAQEKIAAILNAK